MNRDKWLLLQFAGDSLTDDYNIHTIIRDEKS
jgi:hypothetical protein